MPCLAHVGAVTPVEEVDVGTINGLYRDRERGAGADTVE